MRKRLTTAIATSLVALAIIIGLGPILSQPEYEEPNYDTPIPNLIVRIVKDTIRYPHYDIQNYLNDHYERNLQILKKEYGDSIVTGTYGLHGSKYQFNSIFRNGIEIYGCDPCHIDYCRYTPVDPGNYVFNMYGKPVKTATLKKAYAVETKDSWTFYNNNLYIAGGDKENFTWMKSP